MRRFLLVLVPIALAGVWFAVTRGSAPVAARQLSTPTRHAMVGGTRVAMPVLDVGVEHAYDVSLAQSVRPQGGSEMQVSVTGTWAVAYAGSDADLHVFRAQLRQVSGVVRRDADQVTVPADRWSRPYYFTATDDGRLVRLHFPADTDELARGTLTALATLGQRSQIAADTFGDYEATYTPASRGVHRKRARYQRIVGGGIVEATIVETGTDIAVRADGWADVISGREVTRIGTPQFSMLGEQKFELRHASTARIEAGWPDGLEAVAVDAATANARADELDDQQLVDGATLSDLLAAIAQTTDEQARGYQFLRLGALLRIEPNAIDEAARAVAANDPAASMIISALGEAGTPRAQAALARVLDGAALSDDQREQAAIALGLTDAPTRETFDALARASRRDGDPGNTALLAVGNAARNAADDDPAEAARRVDELLAQLARATSDEDRAILLRALGNTGDVRILPAVTAALTTSSVLVRIAATEALRLVPGSEALIAAALRDRVGDVRAAAVFACAERDLAVLASPLATVVQREPEVPIRRAVIELAGDHAVLRALLVHAAARDADRELRELAARLLSALDAA